MLVRKTTISVLILILIVAAGGYWNHRLTERRSNPSTPLSPYTYTIYSNPSSTYTTKRFIPFSSREYVRIIHRITDEQAPYKLQ